MATGVRLPVKTAIYEPPKDGLPYLVVAFEPDGPKVSIANSELEARTMTAEWAIRAGDRQSERNRSPRSRHKPSLAAQRRKCADAIGAAKGFRCILICLNAGRHQTVTVPAWSSKANPRR
ncbi:MAG: hypothetical protein WBF07_15295, partial [Xanthobacteraceae bacterium]